MKNSKNKRTVILAIILLGLLIIGYKVVSTSPNADLLTEESAENNIGEKIGSILKEVESINFNVGVMKESKFMSLKSIEIPLISLPIGKKNPFSDALSN